MREEIRWWADAARRDSQMADTLLREGFFEGAAFHYQQAAEKHLKASALRLKVSWLRTHSCTAILEELGARWGPIPGAVMTAARKLDAHYIPARYPNGIGGAPEKYYDQAIAEECRAACRTITEFANTLMESEG